MMELIAQQRVLPFYSSYNPENLNRCIIFNEGQLPRHVSSYCSVSCVNCERFSLTAQKNQYALTAGCRIGHIRLLGIGLEQKS